MKRTLTLLAATTALAAPMGAAAQTDCGEVSITEMNWASAQVVTAVSTFLMQQGYGCEVSVVPSDTTPAVASLAENGEPDIVTELWLNSTGEAYQKLEDEGRVERLGEVLDPGGVEGWWIPAYLAEEHPELTTLEGIKSNPELLGGRFNNCPDGWGCRIVNDNLIPATGLEEAGFEIFNHGSGETLATSLASAYENEEPWIGYYWGPTALLGEYDMVKVDLGEVKPEIHARNQNPDTDDPGVSDFPAAPVLTSVTTDFADREPAVAEFMSNVTFDVDTMNALLAWKNENSASADETAAYFIQNHADVWSEWLSDEARSNLSGLL